MSASEKTLLLAQWGEWELYEESNGVRLFRAGTNWGWYPSAEKAWGVVDAN